MYNSYVYERLAADRQRQHLHEAAQRRLARTAREPRVRDQSRIRGLSGAAIGGLRRRLSGSRVPAAPAA
jgi:hypothetical protein